MTYKVVQKVKDNYYLYEVTADWDPVKKNSKQKRKYIGKCDKDGNLIAPRSPMVPKVKSLGTVYLMYQMAIDMGLREKLRQVFGEDADALLAVCVHRSTRSALPRHNVKAMELTMLSQLTDVDVTSVLRDTEFTIDLMERNYGNRYEMFRLMDKGESVMVYELNSLQNVEVMSINVLDTNKGFYDFPPMNLFLGISEDPNSAFYFNIMDMEKDPRNLVDVEKDVRALGPHKITFFLDKGPATEDEIESLANSGVLFLKPLQTDSPFCIDLLCRYDKELINNGMTTLLYNTVRKVLDRQIVLGDLRCRLIIMVNEQQRLSQMNALYRAMNDFEQKVSLIKWSSSIQEKLEAIPDEGKVRRLYRIECGPDGMARAVRDEDVLRKTEIYLGKTVLLTNSEESWNVLMFKHHRHDRFKSEADIFRNELQNGSMFMGSLNAAVSTFLSEFIAIAIRTHLSDRLHLIFAGSKNYVDVLQQVRGIYAVNLDGKWYVSELSSEQKAIFESLNIPVPTAEMVESLVEKYLGNHSV